MIELQHQNQILIRLASIVNFPIKYNQLKKKIKENFNLKDEQSINTIINFAWLDNIQYINLQYINLIKSKLNQWKQFLVPGNSIQNCRQFLIHKNFNIRKNEFQNLIKNGGFLNDNSNHNSLNQWKKVIAFLEDLYKLFIKIYQVYYDEFGGNKKQLNIPETQIRKVIMFAYKKYFHFYNQELERQIQQNLQAIYLEISEEQNLYTTVQISKVNMNVPIEQKDYQNAKIYHDQNVFRKKVKPKINPLFKNFKNEQKYFEFLTDQQRCYVKKSMLLALDQDQCILTQQMKRIVIKKIKNLNIAINQRQDYRYDVNEDNNINTMIALYNLFKDIYTGWARHYLKIVFRALNNFKSNYSNFKILLTIQYLEKKQESDILVALRTDKSTEYQSNNSIKAQLKMLADKIKKPPQFIKFQRIKQYRSRVITLYISGLVCQSDDKKEFWRQLHNSFQYESYAVNWKSLQRKQNGFTTLSKFNQIYEESVKVGIYLGYLLPLIFKNHLINLVGFSLGTQVICKCLQTLMENNQISIINKIILLGGVAETNQLTYILDQYPIQTINCYNSKDIVLLGGKLWSKYINKPCGMNQIKIRKKIINIDIDNIKQQFKGHRAKFDDLRKRIQLDNDIFYYIKKNQL